MCRMRAPSKNLCPQVPVARRIRGLRVLLLRRQLTAPDAKDAVLVTPVTMDVESGLEIKPAGAIGL